MRTNRLRISRTTFACLGLISLAVASLVLADERTRSLAFNTLKLICGTLAISLPLGALLGALIARTDLPLRRLAAATMGLLLIVPLYLQAAAWQSGLLACFLLFSTLICLEWFLRRRWGLV